MYYLLHGCIFETKKLLDLMLITNDVSTNSNFEKKLKFDLGYKELSCVKTSPNHLNWPQKYLFTMIKQLGPSTHFITFSIVVNNWLSLNKHLKNCIFIMVKMMICWIQKNLK